MPQRFSPAFYSNLKDTKGSLKSLCDLHYSTQDSISRFFLITLFSAAFGFFAFIIFPNSDRAITPKWTSSHHPQKYAAEENEEILTQKLLSLLPLNLRVSKQEREQLSRTIVRESRKGGLDPMFVAALIHRESTCQKSAKSPRGARGLMQLLPSTAKYISKKSNDRWLGEHALYDTTYNLKLGIAYLNHLSNLFNGDWEQVLIAYNWGPGNLDQALKSKSRIPASAIQYAKLIEADHRRWRSEKNKEVRILS